MTVQAQCLQFMSLTRKSIVSNAVAFWHEEITTTISAFKTQFLKKCRANI